MGHFFISYSRKDEMFVRELRQQLEKHGINCWIDATSIGAGEEWRQEIDRAIVKATAVIAVISVNSTQSQYVTYEWSFGFGAGIPIVPILLQATELHPKLESIQFVDFRVPDQEHWERLIGRLRAIDNPVTAFVISLTKHLNDPDVVRRSEAITALGQLGTEGAREALARATGHVLRAVRMAVALQLTKSGDKRALPGLYEALTADDASVREAAIKVMPTFADAGISETLIGQLLSPDRLLAESSEKVLLKLGEHACRAAVERLCSANVSEDDACRIIDLLERLELVLPASCLRAILSDEKRGPALRRKAAKALGRLSVRDTSDQLFEIFRDAHADRQLRGECALSLARLADGRVRADLMSEFVRPKDIREPRTILLFRA